MMNPCPRMVEVGQNSTITKNITSTRTGPLLPGEQEKLNCYGQI